MNITSFIKGCSNYVYEHMAKNPGNMLLFTGTAGWVLSAIAQVIGLINNKKISNDQKKFLIPQELADAAVNIASFFFITKACTKIGDRLVTSGKLSTSYLRGKLKALKQDSFIGKESFDISKLPQIINKSNPDFDPEFSKKFFDFFDGIDFISSVVGSIISCNIITPFLRNKFAANRQKKALEKDKMQNNIEKPANLTPTSPVLPMQNKLSVNDYKSKVVNNSGGMKV